MSADERYFEELLHRTASPATGDGGASVGPQGIADVDPSRNGGVPAFPPRCAIAISAAEVRRERVEWLEPGRVPLGLVTVLAGVAGLGKSSWTCLLAGRLSRGELGPPAATLMATSEDSLATTVKPRLEAAQADLQLVRFVKIMTAEGEDGLSISDDLRELERLIEETDAGLVVIDPLVAHLQGQIDSHKDQDVRRALAPLHRLAEGYGCAVIALLHLNKATGLAPLARISGSGGFGALARSVLLLDRDPDDPDGEEGNRRVLAHIKCNVGPLAPSLVYEVKPIVLPAASGEPEVETSRLEPLGESHRNGRELLQAPDDEERSAVEEAEEFLRAELAEGSRLAEEVNKAATKLRISEPTLRRARKRLGVETHKVGFTRGWEWSLPKASSAVAPSEQQDGDAFAQTRMDSGIVAGSPGEGVSPAGVTPSGGSAVQEQLFEDAPPPRRESYDWG